MANSDRGVIRENELLSGEEFRNRFSLSQDVFRAMLAAGLPAVKFGRKHFVSGRAVLAWLETLDN